MTDTVTATTQCSFCGRNTTLYLEETPEAPALVVQQLAGTRIRCHAGGCRKLFALNPEKTAIIHF